MKGESGTRNAEWRRAVFLDRDGVINRALERDGKPYPPARLEEVEILPGVPEACALLKQAGFLLVVATNQPDVGRGTLIQEVVEAINGQLAAQLPLDRVEVCYHPGGLVLCDCRKPKPGMLRRAARELGIALDRSWMVGDRWRDVAAGQQAGCECFFIDYEYAEKRPEKPYVAVKSLSESVDRILSRHASKK